MTNGTQAPSVAAIFDFATCPRPPPPAAVGAAKQNAPASGAQLRVPSGP